MTKSLLEIAIVHSPSKLDHPYIKHIYPLYMEKRRDTKVNVLEIGIKRGHSLTMWEEYFPNGKIVGLDKSLHQLYISPQKYPKISFLEGSQQNTKDLDKCLKEINGNYDFIIDDGSHRSDHQLASFKYLFPKMNRKGAYFIEDLMFMSHQNISPSWMINDKGFVTHNALIDYLSYLLRWPLLGRKYWNKIDGTPEDAYIGKRIKAVHFDQHIAVIERNDK